MTTIYENHDKAFAKVAAYVIAKDGERVATIAFKFPADGAGRLWAYVHWIGVEMVRGYAGGFGYDKRSAACASAARKLADVLASADHDSGVRAMGRGADEFRAALARDGGQTWDSMLRESGFDVWQAV